MTNAASTTNPLHWLRRAHLAMRKALDEGLTEYGLSAAQLDVLGHLWGEDGLEQRELQERLGITSATLTGIVDGLVQRQYVERRLSPDDARVKQLFLLKRGRARRDELRAGAREFRKRGLAGFSPEEEAQLEALLRRVAANYGERTT